MLCSIRLLPMPLAFYCRWLNVLSGMEGMWAGLGGRGGARGLWWRLTGDRDPGPTTSNESGFVISAINKYML